MFDLNIHNGKINPNVKYFTVIFEDGFSIDYCINWATGNTKIMTDNFLSKEFDKDLLTTSTPVKAF